jgi:uncharacterized protein involved in tellurium resistance
LAQMSKSISVTSLQSGKEPAWSRALFGQDRWNAGRVASASNRHVVLAVGESAALGAGHIDRVKVSLRWTAQVDLDLHAFCRHRTAGDLHIYFGNRRGPAVHLDRDAGIGNVGGQHTEHLTIENAKDFDRVLFATKIFNKGGSYADYDGRVTLETDDGYVVEVPLNARESADWCIIASFERDRDGTHRVTNLNRVTSAAPRSDFV